SPAPSSLSPAYVCLFFTAPAPTDTYTLSLHDALPIWTLPKNAAAVKSIVSTNFAAKVAESYGVDMINVLTGFKWIADQIHQYETDRKSTRLNSSHVSISYAVFCLKKKTQYKSRDYCHA